MSLLHKPCKTNCKLYLSVSPKYDTTFGYIYQNLEYFKVQFMANILNIRNFQSVIHIWGCEIFIHRLLPNTNVNVENVYKIESVKANSSFRPESNGIYIFILIYQFHKNNSCSSKQQLYFLICYLYWEISFVSSYVKEVWGFEH